MSKYLDLTRSFFFLLTLAPKDFLNQGTRFRECSLGDAGDVGVAGDAGEINDDWVVMVVMVVTRLMRDSVVETFQVQSPSTMEGSWKDPSRLLRCKLETGFDKILNKLDPTINWYFLRKFKGGDSNTSPSCIYRFYHG